jgi:hypothetical protein
MAGGSRFGAGRPAYRPCELSYRSVDVRRFAREGMLGRSGRHGWRWTVDGETVASIGLSVEHSASCILFDYRQTVDGKSSDIKVTVRIEPTPCHFGGSRWWFRCPNCARRCARLFLVVGGMGCQRCLRIIYASQRDDAIGRSWRRTQKIERALGIDGGSGRRMHEKTRERLYDALEREECVRDEMMADGLARLFSNAGIPLPDG